MTKGWRNESLRHKLARMGIETKLPKYKEKLSMYGKSPVFGKPAYIEDLDHTKSLLLQEFKESDEGQKVSHVWMEMTPAQFLELAHESDAKNDTPFHSSGYMTEESVRHILTRLYEHKTLDLPELYAKPLDDTRWKIVGHEGRHRALSAKIAGIPKIKVFVKFRRNRHGPLNSPKGTFVDYEFQPEIPKEYDRKRLVPNYKKD